MQQEIALCIAKSRTSTAACSRLREKRLHKVDQISHNVECNVADFREQACEQQRRVAVKGVKSLMQNVVAGPPERKRGRSPVLQIDDGHQMSSTKYDMNAVACSMLIYC